MLLAWPTNSLDHNPINNLWWKLKKIVNDEAPTCKDDLGTDTVGARLISAAYY